MSTEHRKRLELLWGGSDRPSRGPKPKLSLEQITTTAIAIADAEGLDALSMQRLAHELGYTTMSLYRYVPGKEQLIELMLDRAGGSPPLPEDGQHWRAETETWVRGLWEMYRRHPWAIRLQIGGPPVGPGQLEWFDAGLRPLRRAGLDGGDQIAVVMFLLGATRQLAQISTDIESARTQAGLSNGEAEAGYEATLREFVTPDRFPSLAALVDEGVFAASGHPDEAVDLDLMFGVRRVVDGIASYVHQRTNTPETP